MLLAIMVAAATVATAPLQAITSSIAELRLVQKIYLRTIFLNMPTTSLSLNQFFRALGMYCVLFMLPHVSRESE